MRGVNGAAIRTYTCAYTCACACVRVRVRPVQGGVSWRQCRCGVWCDARERHIIGVSGESGSGLQLGLQNGCSLAFRQIKTAENLSIGRTLKNGRFNLKYLRRFPLVVGAAITKDSFRESMKCGSQLLIHDVFAPDQLYSGNCHTSTSDKQAASRKAQCQRTLTCERQTTKQHKAHKVVSVRPVWCMGVSGVVCRAIQCRVVQPAIRPVCQSTIGE